MQLLHTLGCHLCEQAEALLAPLARERGWRLVQIDIATDDTLLERYGTRIPVLRDPLRDLELGWPFDAERAGQHFAD